MANKQTRFKDIPFELSVKAFGETGSGEVEGYASVFGNIDHARDVIQQGAFAKTLQLNKGKIRFLWQHDRYQPIGAITEMYEDQKGLYFKAKFANTPRGQEARELLKMEGAMGGFSIGFQILQEVIDEVSGINRITEIRLLEVSAVTFPCNEAAVVVGVKSEDDLSEDEAGLLEQFKAFLVSQRSKDAPEGQSEGSEGVSDVSDAAQAFGDALSDLSDSFAAATDAVAALAEATPSEPEPDEKSEELEALEQIKSALELGLLMQTLNRATLTK